MDLSEVQKALAPGAEEALKIPLSYDEFRQAALRTYIDIALRESGGIQRRAAMRIGVTEATISRALAGEALRSRTGPKSKKPPQK